MNETAILSVARRLLRYCLNPAERSRRRSDGPLDQNGPVEPSLTFIVASQPPHHLGVRLSSVGIERDHLEAGVAFIYCDHRFCIRFLHYV
jgi:hypothetical protein